MARRGTHEELKAACDLYLNTEANQKAMTYAPWVLSLMLMVVIREQAHTLDVMEWVKVGVFVVVLPILSYLAKGQLEKQKTRAVETVERVLRSGRGLKELNRLQAGTPRYQGVILCDRIQRAIVHAALVQEARDEDERVRKEREREPARV